MRQELIDIFSILAMVGIAYLMAYWQGRDLGYQSGYEDAFSGKIKLIEFPDGQRKYYKEKDLKGLKKPFTIIENK